MTDLNSKYEQKNKISVPRVAANAAAITVHVLIFMMLMAPVSAPESKKRRRHHNHGFVCRAATAAATATTAAAGSAERIEKTAHPDHAAEVAATAG